MKYAVLSVGLVALAVCCAAPAQDAAPQPGAKPTEHLIGTITAVDGATRSIRVKDDKSGSETAILLEGTRTLIKVPPGAKDLKSATRITADQLAVGDRVDVRGNKAPDDPAKIAARSLVLMSGRDLEAAHAAQAAEWRTASTGVVTAIDPASNKIHISERTPAGRKPMVLQASAATEFTRYSAQTPNTPAASQITQLQPGDQVRVIGGASSDGAIINARRIYSEALRTLNGTVLSIAPDGKSLAIRDLASKQPVEISLNENSALQKLPPEMAMMMVQRLNGAGGPPSASGSGGHGESPAGAAPPAGGAPPSAGPPPPEGAAPPGGGGAMRGPRNGDISRLLERLPKISTSDLKTGDAVVVAGIATGASDGPQQLVATHVIAGVEPLLQSAPARQRGNQSLGGDWGLGEMTVPQ